MLISFLVGYAIGTVIGAVVEAIIEIAIQISSYYNAKEEIKQKAKAAIGSDKDIFSMYVAQANKYVDKDVLVINGYDRRKNQIAKITVTATHGTPLRVGQSF